MLGYNEIQAEFNIMTTQNQCDSGGISITFQEYQVSLCKEQAQLVPPSSGPLFVYPGC